MNFSEFFFFRLVEFENGNFPTNIVSNLFMKFDIMSAKGLGRYGKSIGIPQGYEYKHSQR